MKKLLLLFLTAVISLSGFAQTVIDPLLSEEMNRRNDDDPIKVIVIMKSRYDRTQLNRRADYFATRAQRREFVVNELKSFADASQHDLRQTLAEMQRGNMTSEPTILWMANALYFDATKTAIQDLARRNDIEVIGFAKEYNWIPENEAPRTASPTREITRNVTQVHADRVWALGYTGQGVVVAVIDSGVNYNHLDLASHLWDGGSEFPHHGYDVRNHDNDPMDDHGHGSHCAGTVLGDGKAGSQTGMAPDATLMCVKSIGSDGNGGAQSISEGIQWAVEHGCDLFSMSLGIANSTIPDRTLLRHTCEAALDAGVVAAIAAGNEGSQTWMAPIPNNVRVPGSCPPPYMDAVQSENPGDLTCSVCVGAVDYNDNAAYFTSRGPVTWQNTEFGDYPYQPGIGLIRPDVCAPGVDIKSLNYQSNTGYTTMSGTSMATPCVAGCMALMLSKDINLLPSDVCRILEETALPLAEGKSNTYGFGRVDVFQAVETIQVGFVRYHSCGINDPEGNNNHRLNPGESVTMSLTLQNFATEPVDNVSVVLSSNDPGVTITNPSVDFPAFGPEEILTVEDAFAFSVDENVTSGQSLRFNVAVSVNGEVTGNYSFNVEVYDYVMQYGSAVVLNDDNDDGFLSPGETANLRILVDNSGNEMAQMLTGILSTEYEYVTINDNNKSFNTIGAGMTGYADFNVTLDALAPQAANIPFVLDLEDVFGRRSEMAFNFNNSCRLFFRLYDSGGDGWQGNSLSVSYSDGSSAEQLTLEEGGEAAFTRQVAVNSRIMLRWQNGEASSQCSFVVEYEDGTVVFENSGGFSGNKLFTINCAHGSSVPEFCEPVRDLSYSVDDNLSVTLNWLAPEGGSPVGYEVYRESVLLTTTTELTYTDPELPEGLYNYCVYALYDQCQSEFVCIEAEVSLCGPVQNLDYTMDDDLLLTLTWEAPENTTGLVEYQVYLDNELIASTNELTYAFTIAEGEHDLMVKAVFESCEKEEHVQVCIIGAVQNLAYQMEGHNVVLGWDAIEGMNQYEVYVNGELVTTVETAACTFEVEAGQTTVMVKAVAEGCYVLGASIEICFAEPVTGLEFVSDGAANRFYWKWKNPDDVAHYNVVCNGEHVVELLPSPTGYTSLLLPETLIGENTICVTAQSIHGCDAEPVCLTQMICAGAEDLDYSFNGDELTVTWAGDAPSYWITIDGMEPIEVAGNTYSITLGFGSYPIEIVPNYGDDCIPLLNGMIADVFTTAPEIHIADVHDGYITTEWETIEAWWADADAFNLYRDGELIAENLTETSYKDTGMAINMQHCYAVQAVFEKGVSNLSEAACANYFVGLDENDDKVAIFPNPTTDKVTIQCAGMSLIEVWSAEGKLVKRIKVEGDTYKLTGLESGVFTLRILKGEEVVTRKVIKM